MTDYSSEDTLTGDEKILAQAKRRFQACEDWEAESRKLFVADVKFANGDADNRYQWPDEITAIRDTEELPCLTINKLDDYVRQIVNQMRQSRPRMRAHSMNSEANAKVADVITGIFKHIEVNSDADTAYDTAGEYAVRIGWGYWRVITDHAL